MQSFPYPSPLGAPHPLAGLLAAAPPEIGRVLAGDSSVDVDGYELADERRPNARVGAWWNPLRSIGTTALALFAGGGGGAIVLAMIAGVGASVAGLPQSVLQPLVIAAVGVGLVVGTLGVMRLSHWLAFKRRGENVLVGEQGVSVVRLRSDGGLETTTLTYGDEVLWATSRTRYVRPTGNVVGDVVAQVWLDPRGNRIYETHDFVQGASPRTAALALAMERHYQARAPRLRASLERGEPVAIPLLRSPERDAPYAESPVRPRSFLRFEGGALAAVVDGVPKVSLPLGDLRIAIAEGKCLFHSKSGAPGTELRAGDVPDALLLAALFP